MTQVLRLLSLLVPLTFIGVVAQSGANAQSGAVESETFKLARSDYIENCGGCHGTEGTSAPANIPVLRGRIGYFLCTPEARAYLVRIPNVAHSRLKDNEQLAELLNYAVFDLGGASVPAGAPRFTGAEVAYERQYPLSSQSLKKMRVTLVDSLIRRCRAPASLRLFYSGQH